MNIESHETKVGLVIPTYNEGGSIRDLVNKLLSLEPIRQIVVVDDSVSMETANTIEKMNHPKVKLIKRQGKLGRGSAVLDGFRFLVKDPSLNVFIEMDADFSHNPEEIPQLLNHLQPGKRDLVIGSRYVSGSQIINWPIKRRVFSRLSNMLAKVFLHLGVSDYTNGYRCYTRPAAELIAMKSGRYGKGFISVSETLVRLKLAGFNFGEIPSVFVNRVRGESSVGMKEVVGAFVGLFKISIYYHFTHYFERD